VPVIDPFKNYVPHAKQRDMHALSAVQKKRFVVVVCGRRGGKTYSGGVEFVSRILRDYHDKRNGLGFWKGQGPTPPWVRKGKDPRPFLHYWVIGPTHSLTDEPAIVLQDILGLQESGGLIVSKVKTEMWLLGGIRVDFMSADRPERLVSKGLHGIWLDEAARIKATLWRDDLPAVLSDTRGWGMFTTTPLGRNWVWEDLWCKGDPTEAAALAEEKGVAVESILDDAYGCVTWTTADNTALPHLKAEMEEMRTRMPDAMWRRNYLASFDTFIGQCFGDLKSDRHQHAAWDCRKDYDKFTEVQAGVDWGWRHKGAISVWGRTRDGKWHELETVARSETIVDSDDMWASGIEECWTAIAARLRTDWGVDTFFLPHDNPEGTMYFQKRGLPTRQAYLDRRAALDWFQMAIFNEEIDIATPAVYRELEALHYPEGGSARNAELWVEVNDDRFAASRYALSEVIRNGMLRLEENMTYNTIRR
jgi:hypothetical protein